MERARRRDDDAVELLAQETLERRQRVLDAGVRDGGDGGGAAPLDRLEAAAPDPADAEEAEPRPRRDGAHLTTTALTNPGGRVRASSSAPPSRRSGSTCVSNGVGSSCPSAMAAAPARIPST